MILQGVLAVLLAQSPTDERQAPPPHLVWAERLVRDLRPQDNSYGSAPTIVQWRGVDGATRSRNRSVCSSFITALFRRAYGFRTAEIAAWFGRPRPQAIDFYQVIANANRFQQVRAVGLIEPGDLLASRYLSTNATSTGHVMLVRSRPQLTAACSGLVCVYRLQVIDASRSGHGPDDTRRGAAGVGLGTIQLQTTRQGALLAYRWSEQTRSRWRPSSEEPLLVGRLCALGCRLAE